MREFVVVICGYIVDENFLMELVDDTISCPLSTSAATLVVIGVCSSGCRMFCGGSFMLFFMTYAYCGIMSFVMVLWLDSLKINQCYKLA